MELETLPESNADYHADVEHVSASMLKVLIESPARYHAQFIARTLQPEQTLAMRFGEMFHCAILEPELFRSSYACPPKCDRRTTVGKQAFAAWCEVNRGTKPIDGDDLATLTAMQAACVAHPQLRTLLMAHGNVETPIRWEDGIYRKARPDKVLPQFGVVLDLKTVAHPSPHGFASAAAKFGWWIQADWYLDAAMQAHPEVESWRFLFAAIGKDPPHEVAIYELPNDDADWAEARVSQLVEELQGRIASGDWLSAWQKDITSCPLPRWLRSDFYQVPEEE